MGQQVTLTISAEDTASGVIAKVAEGLNKLTKRSGEAGQATQKIGQAAKESGQDFSHFTERLSFVTQGIKELLSPANLLTSVLGVGLVAELRHAISEAQQFSLGIQRLTLVTGDSMERLGELQDAASKLGIGTGRLQRAFFLLSSEIESGGKNLAKFGVATRDASGAQRSTVDLLELASEKFRKMTSETERAVAARKLFGRGAADLLPLFTLEKEQLEKLGESGREFNKQFGVEGVKSSILLGGAIDEVHEAFSRMHITIISDISPAIKLVADLFAKTVDVFWQIPKPIRTIGEIAAITGTVLLGTILAVKGLTISLGALFASLQLTSLVALAARIGALATPIGVVVAVLTTLVLLGPSVVQFFASMIPQGVIDKWTQFKNAALATIRELKQAVLPGAPPAMADEGTRALAREGTSMGDREQTLAELQEELVMNQKLAQSELQLAKFRMASADYELKASEVRQQATEGELRMKLKQLSDAEDADVQIKEKRKQLEQVLTNTIKAGEAERAKIIKGEALQRLSMENQVTQAYISATKAGQDAAEETFVTAVQLANKTYDLSARSRDDELKRITTIKTANFAYLGARLKLEEAHRDAVISLSAQETAANLTGLKQQEGASNAVFEDLIALRKDDLDNFKITQDQFTAIAMAANDAQLQNKRLVISQELADNEQNRITQIANIELSMKDEQQKADAIKKINADAFAKIISLNGDVLKVEQENNRKHIQLERDASRLHDSLIIESTGKDLAHRAEALEKERMLAFGNANLLRAIDANLFKDRKTLYDQEVQQAVDAALKETALYRNKAQQLIAIEAGRIAQIEAYRQNVVTDIASVLIEQARLVGNLEVAFSVGFAHAASSADDAFKSMMRSGADAYQSLKSGLSDYLFAVITSTGKISDIFINLGKRILRSMTDAFAEILAKQIAMAAGFSLTGFLGIASTAAAGFEGAPNTATQAIVGLGNAAAGSSDALNGMTGILGHTIRALMFFANGLMGILSFFGQIVQGIASGGGIIGTLTAAFSGLVKAGGLLSGVFSGLSSIGTVISSTLQGVGSLAAVFQSVFDAVGLTSGGFAAGPAVAGGTTGLVGGAGQFAQFAADWLPVAGALYSLATTIQSFFNGPLAVSLGRTIGGAIGAAVGSIFGPGGTFIGFSIGSFIGGFIGGLFAPTPKASLSATILPFNRNAMNSSTGMPGNTGTQVGRALVNVGGNIMKNSKEDDLQLALAALLNKLLQDVVTATVGMLKILPPSIATQLDAALTQLETTGLTIVDTTFRGGKAGKKFSSLVKGLMGDALQDLVKALNFGDVDLKALGLDPKDPKGKKGGEIARGFEVLMTALAGLSAIVKAVGPAVTLAGVSLADFTKGALDLFKSFAQKGEPLIDTIKRVMQAFGEIIALRDQVRASIVGLTKDLTEAVSIIKAQMATAETRMVALADALTVAIQSGAKPEDVLATAQAATKAVLDTLKMEIDAVTALHNAVKDLNASIAGSVDLMISLTQKIDTLRGVSVDPESMQASIETITRLFGEITDVTLRISLFGSELVLLAESTGGILANIPIVTAGFDTIMAQIQQMSDPTEAVAALKGLAGAIDAGLQAGIAGINRQTQARITALNVEREAIAQAFAAQQALRKTALETERFLLTEQFNVQKQALQDQLVLAREWKSVGLSARDQLVSLFNLLAPGHPGTSLSKVQAQFETAFAQFQTTPTTVGAGRVQDLAKQLLDLAKQTPGYDLPSAAFQSLAAKIQTALEAIASVAEARPTEEQIQAQMADLEANQAASLVRIDAQLTALNAEQSSQLASIDAQIREATLVGQAQIQQLQALAASKLEAIRAQLTIEITALATRQALAAAALQAVLGDKTFEQFIADKQARAVDLLRSIDRTLQSYLGSIVTALFPGAGPIGTPLPGGTTGIETFIPQAQNGLAYVGQDGPVFLHRGERVLTSKENSAFSDVRMLQNPSSSINISFDISINASGEVNAKHLVDDLESELVERLNVGRLKAAILAVRR